MECLHTDAVALYEATNEDGEAVIVFKCPDCLTKFTEVI